MKKRGQLLDQPLLMIFAMIVGALILAWGFYQVYKLVNVSKDVEVADYVNTLQKDVQRYYYFEPGSSSKFKVALPSDFTYICFALNDNTLNPNPSVRPSNFNPNFMKARKSDNVFAYSNTNVLAYYIPYLRPPAAPKNPLCVKNGEQITLTSKGTYVEVS